MAPRAVVVVVALLPMALAACGVTAPAVTSQPEATGTQPASPSAAALNPTSTRVRTEVLVGSSPDGNGAGAYRYRVEYPQLDGNPGLVRGVDSVIEGRIRRDVAEFLDAARTGPLGARPSDLECMSRTDRATARLAVLRVDCTEEQAGAARPNAPNHTFNCDLIRGRVLTLQDLFTQGSEYLTVLSEAARQQLRAKLVSGDDKTLSEGTSPAVANFKDFLLEKDALVVVFAKYQGAVGADGQPEVDISYGDLERYFASGVKELVATGA